MLINQFSKYVRSLALGVSAAGLMAGTVQAEETVKVGILHSLSGTMAISETSLRDVLMFTFDEINAAGGVMGKKIEPIIVDGASNWPLFAEKAKQLSQGRKVTVLHQGHVLCEGPMDEVQNDERVLEVYLGRKQRHAA